MSAAPPKIEIDQDDNGGSGEGSVVPKKDSKEAADLEQSFGKGPTGLNIGGLGVTVQSPGSGSSGGSSPTASSSPSKKTALDYIFGKVIGEGSFSSVYLTKDVNSGQEFAIKVCDKQHIIRERKAELIKRERDVMTILSSNKVDSAPFFVHLYATFQDASRLYFVMTLAEGGELLKYLKRQGRFEKIIAQFYAGEILQALKHLHKLKIVHRDLKPENILLNRAGHILITDFGSSKIMTEPPAPPSEGKEEKKEEKRVKFGAARPRNNSFVGTPQYVVPEILQGRYDEVGPAADLWAFGCIVYQFLSGQLCFFGESEFLIMRKVVAVDYSFPDNFDEDGKDLVGKLLKFKWTDRLGATDVQYYTSIESHQFFTGVNFEALHEQLTPIMNPELSKTASPLPLRSFSYVSKVTGILKIPDNYEPGFNPQVMAYRFLTAGESDEDTAEGEDNTDGHATSLKKMVEDAAKELKNLELPRSSSPNVELSKARAKIPDNDAERQVRLEEQIKSCPWHKVTNGSLIIKQGLVTKRKGIFSRKRMLVLTDAPKLFYCDPSSMDMKGEIPWSSSIKIEAKDFKNFQIITPNRTYHLEDPEGYALLWCDAVNGMLDNIRDKQAFS